MTYIKELETKDQITIRLEPNTMYYFDNEAFKLLINRVMDLESHQTEESITLDKARRSILQLAAAMTKLNENNAIELEAIRAESMQQEISKAYTR
ncbi:hypothetical protein BGZ52_008643, partial [Haplosporangium bisporale]